MFSVTNSYLCKTLYYQLCKTNFANSIDAGKLGQPEEIFVVFIKQPFFHTCVAGFNTS